MSVEVETSGTKVDGIILTDEAAGKVKSLLEQEGRDDLSLRGSAACPSRSSDSGVPVGSAKTDPVRSLVWLVEVTSHCSSIGPGLCRAPFRLTDAKPSYRTGIPVDPHDLHEDLGRSRRRSYHQPAPVCDDRREWTAGTEPSGIPSRRADVER